MERVMSQPAGMQGERPELTPDWAARKIIIAAFCYYVLDDPIMSDGRYDRLSRYVANNWDDLHGDRKWALRDPDSTDAGGSHIWFSQMAASASLNYHKYKTGRHMLIDTRSLRVTRRGQNYYTCDCRCYEDTRFSNMGDKVNGDSQEIRDSSIAKPARVTRTHR